jgi:hypothetical protein
MHSELQEHTGPPIPEQPDLKPEVIEKLGSWLGIATGIDDLRSGIGRSRNERFRVPILGIPLNAGSMSELA